VTIKVPVVPFTMPVVTPPQQPLLEQPPEEQGETTNVVIKDKDTERRRRREERREKRKAAAAAATALELVPSSSIATTIELSKEQEGGSPEVTVRINYFFRRLVSNNFSKNKVVWSVCKPYLTLYFQEQIMKISEESSKTENEVKSEETVVVAGEKQTASLMEEQKKIDSAKVGVASVLLAMIHPYNLFLLLINYMETIVVLLYSLLLTFPSWNLSRGELLNPTWTRRVLIQ